MKWPCLDSRARSLATHSPCKKSFGHLEKELLEYESQANFQICGTLFAASCFLPSSAFIHI